MTADNNNEATGTAQEGGAGKPRGRKTAKKRSGSRSSATKRGRTTVSRRPSASRSGSDQASGGRGRSRRRSSTSSSGGGLGSRLLASAGRAIPLASRALPDQRMVQRLVDQRPYMLGAIGLGIGAMIGLMLPGTLSSMTGRSRRSRNSR